MTQDRQPSANDDDAAGGEATDTPVSPAAGLSGDMSAGRSERTGGSDTIRSDDPGAPGGMGGVHAPAGKTGLPPGGVSPFSGQKENDGE
jgi:hypothetical protein